MDGNGRWATQRGLPRTEGHRAGEAALMDVLYGAMQLGIGTISAYAFSTENWTRSPEEVRFLMGFNKEVIRRRRDELNELGVRIRWAGRRPRLWRTVIDQLVDAEEYTRKNDRLTLQFCVNYGGRAELGDAARAVAQEVAAGRLRADRVDEKTLARYLYHPDIPDVDLFVRSSGEQRTSNFLLWQSAYAELVFLDTLWPDFDRSGCGGPVRSTPAATAATAGPNNSSQPSSPTNPRTPSDRRHAVRHRRRGRVRGAARGCADDPGRTTRVTLPAGPGGAPTSRTPGSW